MSGFEQAGEAVLLAAEGQAQLAQSLAAWLKRRTAGISAWLAAMPTTLPPTQSWPK